MASESYCSTGLGVEAKPSGFGSVRAFVGEGGVKESPHRKGVPGQSGGSSC